MDNLGLSGNPFLGQDNPYLQKQIDGTMGDMARNWNLLQKPNQESAMVSSGSFGNSGLEQLQQNAMLNQQQAMGQTANNMRMQDYGQQQNMYQWDQGFNKSIYDTTFNQNQQNLQTTMGLLGTMNGYNQQDIQNSTNIQNTPMQYWQQFNQGANSIGGQGGSATTPMPGNQTAGFLGGAQLGQSVYDWGSKNMGWGNSPMGQPNAGPQLP
jgi:hypothetical protein